MHGADFPDALSKTIPIWCAVLNALLFPGRQDTHKVRSPPEIITPSELEQMNARVPGFLAAVKVRAELQTPHLRPH